MMVVPSFLSQGKSLPVKGLQIPGSREQWQSRVPLAWSPAFLTCVPSPYPPQFLALGIETYSGRSESGMGRGHIWGKWDKLEGQGNS